MKRTLQGALLARLEEDAGRPAIAFVDGAGRCEWESRQRFLERAAGAASVLADAGLRAGDVGVVVSVDPREAALAVAALLVLGAQPILVAPPAIQGTASSLRDVLLDVVRRTAARACLVPRAMKSDVGALEAASPGVHVELGFERLLGARPGRVAFADRAPRDVAALQLTSGTTGFPRIAVWEQERVVGALDAMARAMALGPDDVCVNWTPLYHDMGLVNNFLLCLAHGVPLALLSPLDVVRRPAFWLRALADAGATTTWSPNFGFALAAERARDEELDGVRLERVRGFWNAAERVHVATFERFHDRFARFGVRRAALRANFGCVETIGGVTFTDPAGALVVERVDEDALRSDGVARVVADGGCAVVGCGRAAAGAELRVLDEHGRALPDGVVGELAVRTSNRFVGYLGDLAATGEALRGELVVTGDLAYLRAGELFWTGRSRERINLQGRKVDPSELERVLFAVDGLRTGCFCAFGVEDPERGTEVLVVLAEVEPAAETDRARLAATVRREVATRLGLAIEDLVLVRKGALTKTSSGKRRHRHFRALYLAGELDVLHRTGAGRI